MNSKQWKDLIKQEFGVSGSLAAKMYHEMLKPYKINISCSVKCPYYKFIKFDYDKNGYYYCMARKGGPRCDCGGFKSRCEI